MHFKVAPFHSVLSINAGALSSLPHLLTNNHKKSIKKEGCWIISNITARNKEQIQAVIEAGLIAPLMNLLQNAEFDVKKEVACAIATCYFWWYQRSNKVVGEPGLHKAIV